MSGTPLLPQPTHEAAMVWLKQLNREELHNVHWALVNREFHEVIRAMRPFIQQHYEFGDQEAFYDGLTLGLLTMLHFTDIETLAERLADVIEAPA